MNINKFVGEWVTFNYDLVRQTMQGPGYLKVTGADDGLQGDWAIETDGAQAKVIGTLHSNGREWQGTWSAPTQEGSFRFDLAHDGRQIHGERFLGKEGPSHPFWGIRMR